MVGKAGAGKKILQGILVGIAGTFMAAVPWSLNWLDTWEAKTWDWRSSVLSEPGRATDDIRLIMIDQNSLDWAYRENGITWPWPRELYAVILNYCKRNGAKAVAFDVLFTEPSKYGLDDDMALGSSVADYGSFAGAVFLGKSAGRSLKWPEEIPRPDFRIKGLDEWLDSLAVEDMVFPRATLPVDELAKHSTVLCNTHLEPDKDGTYRRVKLFGVFDRNTLPSLGIGTYIAGNKDKKSSITQGHLFIGETDIPIDKNGSSVLRFRGPSGTYKTYSAAAVLQSEIRLMNGEEPTIQDGAAFKDKYVLFGFSAPGLFDLRSAPVGGVYTGVEIHATMLDNFLSQDFIRTTPLLLVFMLTLLLALLCGIFASYFSSPMGILTTGAFFAVIPVFLSLGSYIRGVWLPLIVLEAAAVSSLVLAMVVNYATEGRQKRFIKNAFKQYLSPAVIDQLVQNPERLKLGGERRILSIFFSDLQGFTSISEGLDPESLTNLLNDYLSAMTEIIQEEGGTVDKYEGDAIIAFWNAPLEVFDHATRVVRAALRCQAKLTELRPVFRKRIGTEMFMRIGINTGPAVVGNLGSHTRFDYTMLGDSVNLAARLEGINKQFGTYTMISESTRSMAGNTFSMRELARVAVVGRKEPVTVYEPMFPEEHVGKTAALSKFKKGLNLFYEGSFADARNIFSAIKDFDPAAAAYERKCSELISTPPEKWDGVWIMTSK